MTFKDKPKRDGGKTISRDKKPKGPGKPAAEREKKPTEAKAAPAPETVGGSKPERISKIMARAGVASRRDVERMIMEGRVSLNGVKLDTPVVNATLSDKIEVDGMPIRGAERTRLWLYHKPAGLVTTNSDPEGRPTVFDNLPSELPRVLSIGRLDINTEGLLLLTNDGGLSRVLELPTTGWLRRYRVRAHGEVDQAALDKLKEGIAVDGVLYGAIDATLDRTQGHNVWISMGLREGKNREIKNVLGALGLEVNRLIRVSYGPFQLGDLAEGKVLEVRGRMLRDQLGPRLIEQAGANFDAPIYNAPVEDEEDNTSKRAVKSEWAKSDAPEGKPRFDKAAGKPEDRREKALGRLDTKRGDKPAGKFGSKPAGKFGAKGRSEDDGDDRRPRQPAGTSRTANVWMAPGARPTRDGKERKSSARAEAENLFKKPSAQDEARRNVVRHADAEGEWIRSDSPREEEGGRGRGDRPRGEKSFGDRGGRGGKPFGDRPFRDRPREEGDRPRSDRPRGEKSFGDRPARGGKPFGDRPFRDKPREEGDRPRSDRPRGEKSFGDRTARGEKPFGDRPFRDRPREDGERPRGERPAGDKPRGGKPGGKPGFGKPSFGKSGERGERSGFSGKSKGPGGPGGGKPGGKGPGGKPSGGRGMTRNADRRR
ncbi:pseudouridine synthase [Agrobacterium tumefaciens]|uniref:Pseudouridine synthase n=1 Tax=Agrobacterium tumefaciens TaxID=358 RepID=A0AAW8LSY6_AGRTU|nr:pseudouridine synthase [Agrobacterium tumefaciens]MBP2564019.1 23S rRNA pseudouridine2605 synthase [Agrobacterium tumefaciens]MDR6702118.1 23S rRNA pseudouridine2605 synthase [Agrobacterium tumefaciens]TCV55680.1 23S rRNA pseudouridine2605 synthase [Agrobacterium tumefaciens]